MIQTHANIAANTKSICEYLRLTAADRAMAILPLCYCYGKSLLQTHIKVGGSIFFDHRFMYPRLVLETIGEQQCMAGGVLATVVDEDAQVPVRAVGRSRT